MPKDLASDDLMVRYLLGDMSGEEQVQLEERYLVDDNIFEQLSALEDELIDSYVHGELSERQREQFELKFQNSAEQRRKLAFAESLARYLSEASGVASAEKQPTRWQRITEWLSLPSAAVPWAFAAVGTAVLLVGAWLIRDDLWMRTQLRKIQAEQSELRQRNEQLSQQLAQFKGPLTGSATGNTAVGEVAGSQPHSLPVVAMTLAPGVLRSNAEDKTLIIPPGSHLVQLQLDVESNQSYESYLATLETAEGNRVWSGEGLKTSTTDGRPTVVLELPSSLFSNKDYILKLRGVRNSEARADQYHRETGHLVIEEIAGYSFRVVKN